MKTDFNSVYHYLKEQAEAWLVRTGFDKSFNKKTSLVQSEKCDNTAQLPSSKTIKLLSFNVQVGISTSSYRHYVTRSWQHLLPHRQRLENLNKIATLLQRYDVVALQEVDGGSLRSGNVNQVQYLAEASGFPHWYQQLNRNMGRFAQHSNGLLSKFPPFEVKEHKLPGVLPGRGVIIAKFGKVSDPLVLVITHLSLSQNGQAKQLAFVQTLVKDYRHIVLMGDMNCQLESLLKDTSLKNMAFRAVYSDMKTFPSWHPVKALDHILVSSSLRVISSGVVSFPVSDHLPVALELALPEDY